MNPVPPHRGQIDCVAMASIIGQTAGTGGAFRAKKEMGR